MIGIGTFIGRYKDPIQAERALMDHYAAKRKRLSRWDRRYAHMQFVLKWAPIFRRHVSCPINPADRRRNPLAA